MEKLNLSGKSKHGEGVDDSMRGLSAVFVDGEDVYVDNGAIHAKSRVERNLKFVKTLDELPNPREVDVFWVTLHRFEGNVQGYYGLIPFRLYVDDAAQLGYKSLSQQVNGMDKAVKGKVDMMAVAPPIKAKLGDFLRTIRPELWEQAGPGFLAAFPE